MVFMALHVNIFAALTENFANPFVCENVACVFDFVVPYDIRKFDTDAISYGAIQCKKMDISMFLVVFSVRLWWNQVKYARIRPLSLFLHYFCRYSLCFSPGRDQLLGGGGQTGKNQPPYQPST